MDYLYKKMTVFAGITALVYLLLFFFFDKTIDLWVHATFINTWVFHAGTYVSYLANGAYIKLALALGFIVILIIDPGLKKRWTRSLLYICLSAAIAIIVGDGLKYLLARYRPIMLFEHNLYGLHFFSSEWDMNSTPSGHTIRAFSILTALSMLFRRFSILFITFAVLVGLSRVAVTAHYPSDVVFGAFVGIFIALWTYKHSVFNDNKHN